MNQQHLPFKILAGTDEGMPGDFELLYQGATMLFLRDCSEADYLTGRVLDYGAGRAPFRDLVKGKHISYDKQYVRTIDAPDDEDLIGPFDAILCTDVMQSFADPIAALAMLIGWLKPNGRLVLTYRTNGVEEAEDLRRYTEAGMASILSKFAVLDLMVHEKLAVIDLGGGYDLAMGYGIVARRKLDGELLPAYDLRRGSL